MLLAFAGVLTMLITGCSSIEKTGHNSYTLNLQKLPYAKQKKWHTNYGEFSLMQNKLTSRYYLVGGSIDEDLKMACKEIEKISLFHIADGDVLKFEGVTDQGTPIHEIVSLSKRGVVRTIVEVSPDRQMCYKIEDDLESLLLGKMPDKFENSVFYSFEAYRHKGPAPSDRLEYENLSYYQDLYIDGLASVEKDKGGETMSFDAIMDREAQEMKAVPVSDDNVIPKDQYDVIRTEEKIRIDME